jgi:putative transposase
LEYQRKSTKPKDIAYSLYLFYFLGLSYRNTAKALQRLVRRSHVSILKWIQKYRLKKISLTRTKVSEFIIDETPIKVGSELIWLLVVAIEPTHSKILHIDISLERTMLVAERFIAYLIDKYGKHPISTDDGIWYPPQACQFLKLDHHIHSFYEKSIIEGTNQQYIKTGLNALIMITFLTEKRRNVN